MTAGYVFGNLRPKYIVFAKPPSKFVIVITNTSGPRYHLMLLPLVRRKVGLGCMSGQCTPMRMSWNPLNCCHYIMAFIVKTKTGYFHQIFNLLIKRHVTLFTHYPQFVPLLYNPPSTAGWCHWWWIGPCWTRWGSHLFTWEPHPWRHFTHSWRGCRKGIWSFTEPVQPKISEGI